MKKYKEGLFKIGEVAKIMGIETTGSFRSIFLEGPPNRGENSGDYITQIAVPIEG